MCAIKRMKLVRLTIGENIVSFTNLTEPQLISGHIGRITEWVIPQSQAFELVVNIFEGGSTRYFQNLVVILNFHSVSHFYFIFFN